jgi:hypothetical protein
MALDGTYNNLMELGGSLGNVSQKLEKLVIKTRKKSTLENGLRVRNISSFYNQFFFFFCGTLPSEPPDFIEVTKKYIITRWVH